MDNEGTNVLQISTIFIAAFVGVCVYLLFYILKQINNGEEKNVGNVVVIKKNEKRVELGDKRKDLGSNAKSKKKAAWTGRSDKQSFTHPWLLTSLKGHTGEVLDMDFASNGKYLVSCAEEEPDPGGKLDGRSGSSGSNTDSSQENSVPSSENPSPRTGLSRRQRKNRRRDDLSPENKKKYKSRKDPITTTTTSSSSRKPIVHSPLKQYLKMSCISEPQLASLMQTFFLSPEQMLIMGYPLQGVGYHMASRTYIFKSPLSLPKSTPKAAPKHKESKFDVNAQEFVPGMEYAEIKAEWSASHDSGQGSASSSENLDDSEESSTSVDGYAPAETTKSQQEEDPRNLYEIGESHNCTRCNKIFFISHSGEYLTHEQCVYHWGKLHNVIATIGKHCDYVMEYSCCKGKPQSRGCTTGKLHVWSGLSVGFNGPYDSYVRTRPRKTLPPDGNFGIYALDCEMCYTVMGLELTKVTVIGVDGRLVYDSFVKPEHEIIDYNTRFSGITSKDLTKKSGTKTLREVQNDLMGFINADTILIGHGLENDLRALRIMHYTVVDTAVVFAHPYGLPYRRGLKAITSWILKRDIQCSSNGHNSYEDARACMELILWKVRRDFLKPMDPY